MNNVTSNNTAGIDSHFRQLYEEAPLPYQSLDAEGRRLKSIGHGRKPSVISAKKFSADLLVIFRCLARKRSFGREFIDFAQHNSMHAIEFEFSCKDGSRKLMAVSGRIARDSQGQFQRTHCILNDITEHRIIEKALEESELKYRLAMEATQDGLWDWDVDNGKCVLQPELGSHPPAKTISQITFQHGKIGSIPRTSPVY